MLPILPEAGTKTGKDLLKETPVRQMGDREQEEEVPDCEGWLAGDGACVVCAWVHPRACGCACVRNPENSV